MSFAPAPTSAALTADEARGAAALFPLLRELNDLKRLRDARAPRLSYAGRLFARAWAIVVERGECSDDFALSLVADALATTRLSCLDAESFAQHGVDGEGALQLAVEDACAGRVAPALAALLLDHVSAMPVEHDSPPQFVEPLTEQPRAGATYPGQPRAMLEPAETHADHCLLTAVNAVLWTGVFGGAPGTALLIGLAHHLFNVTLPDVGFAGDRLLTRAGVNDALGRAAWAAGYALLPEKLHAPVRAALEHTRRTDTPLARCFHAADVCDRVLEMDWHARAAAFTLAHATRDLHIVHEGFEQAFQLGLLRAAGVDVEAR